MFINYIINLSPRFPWILSFELLMIKQKIWSSIREKNCWCTLKQSDVLMGASFLKCYNNSTKVPSNKYDFLILLEMSMTLTQFENVLELRKQLTKQYFLHITVDIQ